MGVWRLHLITGASPFYIASRGWGLSKCHSAQTTVLLIRLFSLHFASITARTSLRLIKPDQALGPGIHVQLEKNGAGV